ncbi:ferritin-like domain-containing protein [Pendulispora albinea]|uniref:Ferritin-like domain-containing protein n=1 Tax=Pendulispora albinea TaxID=2741071 RepID=A0ABZ2MAM1_9BACT
MSQASGCGTNNSSFELKGDSGNRVDIDDPTPFDERLAIESFEPLRCYDPRHYDLTELAINTGSDYIDLRSQHWRNHPDGGDDVKIVADVAGSGGTACATASDRPACARAVAAVNATGGFVTAGSPIGFENAFVRTRGNDVAVFRTKEEVAALFGPIDVGVEAWLRAYMEGYTIACGERTVRVSSDGFEVIAKKVTGDCDPIVITRYLLRVARDGTVAVLADEIASRHYGYCIGRRPEGLEIAVPSDSTYSPVGRYFAEVAHLEAASVIAFRALERELTHHGAPRSLRRRAARAARDEMRHAAMTARIAKRYGATAPTTPVVASRKTRSLEAMAIENAVEGCVRETFGALVATYQAERAGDAVIAAAMRIIARDETRHAGLAWEVAAWLDEKLSPKARARVAHARAAAICEMLEDAHLPVAAELTARAGQPPPRESARMAAELARAMYRRPIAETIG